MPSREASQKTEKRKHRTSAEPKRRKTNMDMWNEIPVVKVCDLPEDIDGTVVYLVNFNLTDRMKSTKDRRPWKEWMSSSSKKFCGVRRKTTCSGSTICRNLNCDFLKFYNRSNQVQFSSSAHCSVCGEEGDRVHCDAVKIWEFDDIMGQVTVYHHGIHSCSLIPKTRHVSEDVNERFRKNRKTTPTQAANGVLSEKLEENEIDWDQIYHIVDTTIDTKKLNNAKTKIIEEEQQYGQGMEAVANLRKKVKHKDPYFIYKINDENMNGETTFIFKMSKCQADIALAMNCNEDGYLNEEYCFGDGTFDRCIGYTTIGVHVYHPLLRRIISIATMQTPKRNGESKECWTLFWSLFNEVLQDHTGDFTCLFNPRGWCFDEGGGSWAALKSVFGDESADRGISCEKHFSWSVDKFASSFQPKSSSIFKELGMGLMQAATSNEYSKTFNDIVEFIEQKPDKRGFLHGFLRFWHPRRSHFSRAFKSSNAPKMNMSETIHAAYKNAGQTKLSLLEASHDDIIYSIKLEQSLVLLGEGVNCMGHGPTAAGKRKRQFHEDKRKSNKYADNILHGDHTIDEAGPSGIPNEPRSKHRPDNPSTSHLSSSDDDITPRRADITENKRLNRRRSGKSKEF